MGEGERKGGRGSACITYQLQERKRACVFLYFDVWVRKIDEFGANVCIA